MGTADKRGRLNRESVTNSNWDKGRERENKEEENRNRSKRGSGVMGKGS